MFEIEQSVDTPFRYTGELADTSKVQWDVSNIPESEHEVNGKLGDFSGCFTENDTILTCVQKNDIKFRGIERLYGTGNKPEIDEQLSQSIQAQKLKVLNDALHDAFSDTYTLVVRPLLVRD